MLSTNSHISRAPGRIYHTKVKSYPFEIFSGRYIFIDHVSDYMSIKKQVAINATRTVKGKNTFDRED